MPSSAQTLRVVALLLVLMQRPMRAMPVSIAYDDQLDTPFATRRMLQERAASERGASLSSSAVGAAADDGMHKTPDHRAPSGDYTLVYDGETLVRVLQDGYPGLTYLRFGPGVTAIQLPAGPLQKLNSAVLDCHFGILDERLVTTIAQRAETFAWHDCVLYTSKRTPGSQFAPYAITQTLMNTRIVIPCEVRPAMDLACHACLPCIPAMPPWILACFASFQMLRSSPWCNQLPGPAHAAHAIGRISEGACARRHTHMHGCHAQPM
jgi:hypothetical protein